MFRKCPNSKRRFYSVRFIRFWRVSIKQKFFRFWQIRSRIPLHITLKVYDEKSFFLWIISFLAYYAWNDIISIVLYVEVDTCMFKQTRKSFGSAEILQILTNSVQGSFTYLLTRRRSKCLLVGNILFLVRNKHSLVGISRYMYILYDLEGCRVDRNYSNLDKFGKG